MLIRRVEVKYFRSIYSVTLRNLRGVNVFSGRNDAGKSNVLRALNLFFNNQTDWQRPIVFHRDLSSRRLDEVRLTSIKGKQFISIEVEFNRPSNYRGSLPNVFRVRRTWHRDSSSWEQVDNLDALHRARKLPKSVNTARRALSAFLNRVHFEYVPAVKDRQYFDHLLSRLQTTLLHFPLDKESGVAKVADDLADKIGEEVKTLQTDFKRATGFETTIEPPNEFAALFQSFTTSTSRGADRALLSERGDGIQARYVPSALNYIASASRDFFVWGFEEPENSLEPVKADDLAKDLLTHYSKNSQIFITTHSPAFLSLRDKPENVTCFRAFRDSDHTVVVDVEDPALGKEHADRLDEELGLLHIQKKVHDFYKSQLAEFKTTRERVTALENEILSSKLPLVLTEGKTDRLILETAWRKIRPGRSMPFICRAADTVGPHDGGNGGASSAAKAIESIHPDDNRVAIAIFDRDGEGLRAFESLSKNFSLNARDSSVKSHRNGLAFALLLPIPPHRHEYAGARNLPIEYLFTDSDIAKKTSSGRGIKLSEPKLKIVSDGGRQLNLPTPAFSPELLGPYRLIDGDKTAFAEIIVPSLSKESFAAFEALFDSIETILMLA